MYKPMKMTQTRLIDSPKTLMDLYYLYFIKNRDATLNIENIVDRLISYGAFPILRPILKEVNVIEFQRFLLPRLYAPGKGRSIPGSSRLMPTVNRKIGAFAPHRFA